MESRKLFVDGKETEFPTKFPHLCTEEKNVRNHFRPKNPQNLTIHINRMPEKKCSSRTIQRTKEILCILDLCHVLNHWIWVNIHQTPGLQEKSCNFFLGKIELIFSLSDCISTKPTGAYTL